MLGERTESMEIESMHVHSRRMNHKWSEEELLRRLKGPAGVASLGALRYFQVLVAKRRRELILEARAKGWGWYQLGMLLDVSQQAVQQQWKRYVTADENEEDDE